VENAPWVITQEYIDEQRLDIISHGEDLSVDADGNDAYAFVKKQGKFRVIKRTEGVSTSELISRIVSRRNEYIQVRFLRF
jgi:glycerol-3-phosphate cytidylyltransferase-like family protein